LNADEVVYVDSTRYRFFDKFTTTYRPYLAVEWPIVTGKTPASLKILCLRQITGHKQGKVDYKELTNQRGLHTNNPPFVCYKESALLAE
jgi:hypothetical protein